jgi:hypothetical protein
MRFGLYSNGNPPMTAEEGIRHRRDGEEYMFDPFLIDSCRYDGHVLQTGGPAWTASPKTLITDGTFAAGDGPWRKSTRGRTGAFPETARSTSSTPTTWRRTGE